MKKTFDSPSERAALALMAALFAATPARATMPVNPDRPLTTQSCAQARARVAEARLGNPLLNPAGNRAALRLARADEARLCAHAGPRR